MLLSALAASGASAAAAVTAQVAAQSGSQHGGHGGAAAPATGPSANAGAQLHNVHGHMLSVGDVDNARNGFDPTAMLTDWDTGTVSKLPDGRTLRTFEVVAEDKEIEIAPGVMFPAWTYNGRVPGPTLRVTEGDRLRIVFKNYGSHPHSMHFHGIHSARMDGVPGAGVIGPGDEFVYEFDALPFGCHLYHCHALPLKRHIHKGMYGAFIIDPDPARHPGEAAVARSRLFGSPENREWQEFVMVMNAFDTNFDGENEVYAVNTVGHHYMKHPIRIERRKPVRIYLINVTEFDPINSLPPARQFLRLLRPRHDADADAQDRRHDHAVPGAARHPRVHLPRSRAGPVHVPRAPVRVRRARLDGHVRRYGRGGMNETSAPSRIVTGPAERQGLALSDLIWLALPIALLALAGAWLLLADPLRVFSNGAPPVEKLTFERTLLDHTGIHLQVRAGGSEPMTIAQVQVDEAYWSFTQDPPGALPRMASAWLHIPYPVGARRGAQREGPHQHRHRLRARDPRCGGDAGGELQPAAAAGPGRRLRRHLPGGAGPHVLPRAEPRRPDRPRPSCWR